MAAEPTRRPLPAEDDRETVLIRVTGPDKPGITAELMDTLATAEAELADIEQIVIRGHLVLGLVVDITRGHDLLRELLALGWKHGVDVDFQIVDGVPTVYHPGLVVTVLASDVHPFEFGAVASAVAANGGNIDRIVRLARYPVMAYELFVRCDDPERVRDALLATSRELVCDVAVHREGLGRRSSRLVVMDVDSTLIQDEMIDLLAAEAGTQAEVAAVTERAMAGELDFEESLRARVATLAGLDAAVLDTMKQKVRLTPGASTFCRTLRRLGYRTALVSGGFLPIVEHLQTELGIDHAFANELEIVDGRLTGNVIGDIVDREAKARILRSIAEQYQIPAEQVVAVGDGANDLDMLSAAGLGIAFNAKPIVRAEADASLRVPYLDAILFVLGVRREDIEAADCC